METNLSGEKEEPWRAEEALLSRADEKGAEEEEEAPAEEEDEEGDWVKPTFSLMSLSNVTHFIVLPLDPWNMRLLSHPTRRFPSHQIGAF